MNYKEIKDSINKLISESNAFRKILKFFLHNQIAELYYERAKKELLENNCQSVTSMVITALEYMTTDIEIIQEDNNDLLNKNTEFQINKLVNENIKLKQQLEDAEIRLNRICMLNTKEK